MSDFRELRYEFHIVDVKNGKSYSFKTLDDMILFVIKFSSCKTLLKGD